jgi:hypothetical protein
MSPTAGSNELPNGFLPVHAALFTVGSFARRYSADGKVLDEGVAGSAA